MMTNKGGINMMENIKRILFDVVIFAMLILVYTTEFYVYLPQPVQLVALKALLVSMGFLHAHITRKLAFGSVNWENGLNSKAILSIILYVVIIYAYATGG